MDDCSEQVQPHDLCWLFNSLFSPNSAVASPTSSTLTTPDTPKIGQLKDQLQAAWWRQQGRPWLNLRTLRAAYCWFSTMGKAASKAFCLSRQRANRNLHACAWRRSVACWQFRVECCVMLRVARAECAIVPTGQAAATQMPCMQAAALATTCQDLVQHVAVAACIVSTARNAWHVRMSMQGASTRTRTQL